MKLGYFKFTFEPYWYAHQEGDEIQVRAEIELDGHVSKLQNVLRIKGIEPWESEIDYYMNRIAEQIKSELKKKNEEPHA